MSHIYKKISEPGCGKNAALPMQRDAVFLTYAVGKVV